MMSEQHYSVDTYVARDSVGYMVRRLYSMFAERIERAFAAHECTLTQWIVLMYVRDGIARTAGEICREFRHDSGALTRVIDQLEIRGLLERRRSLRDRRVVELELTPRGEEFIRSLLPVIVANLNCALAPLSAAEFKQFRGYLARVLDHMQSSVPPDVPSAAPEIPALPGRAAPAGRTKPRRGAGR